MSRSTRNLTLKTLRKVSTRISLSMPRRLNRTDMLLMHLQQMTFEKKNIVVKGEIAQDEQFHFFSTMQSTLFNE